MRQAGLLAMPSRGATRGAPSSASSAKQSSTATAVDTDRSGESSSGGPTPASRSSGGSDSTVIGSRLPLRELVGRRHVHLGDPVAVGDERAAGALAHLDPDLL